MTTPRAFIVRHGETEWSLNGRHTGTTELPLTANGERRVRATGRALVGDDRLIVPGKIGHIYVSPRHRARRTLELLNIGCRDRFPWQQPTASSSSTSTSTSPSSAPPEPTTTTPPDTTTTTVRTEAKVQICEDIREWDYGDYEGLTSAQIREQRGQKGLNTDWDIWRDGCPGGEGPAEVTARLDGVIRDIRGRFHGKALRGGMGKGEKSGGDKGGTEAGAAGGGGGGGGGGKEAVDVLLIAHGHILRAFAMRWIGKELTEGVTLLLEAGGVGTLSYEHHSIDEPAILLGGAFVVDLDTIQPS